MSHRQQYLLKIASSEADIPESLSKHDVKIVLLTKRFHIEITKERDALHQVLVLLTWDVCKHVPVADSLLKRMIPKQFRESLSNRDLHARSTHVVVKCFHGFWCTDVAFFSRLHRSLPQHHRARKVHINHTEARSHNQCLQTAS